MLGRKGACMDGRNEEWKKAKKKEGKKE